MSQICLQTNNDAFWPVSFLANFFYPLRIEHNSNQPFINKLVEIATSKFHTDIKQLKRMVEVPERNFKKVAPTNVRGLTAQMKHYYPTRKWNP